MKAFSCGPNLRSSAPPRPAPIIVSVHVPKCAGTSFRHHLAAEYGAGLWLNYGGVFTRDDAGPGCVPKGTEVIHGHFFADAFDEVCPGRRLVTWVRHPVERVVSNFHHFLRNPDMRDDCCRLLHEQRLSLMQFAELPWMRNEATRYLAHKPHRDFAAIGVVERTDASLAAMGAALGWRAAAQLARVNCNPHRTSPLYLISREEREYLGYLNALDIEWHAQAMVRLEDDLRVLDENVA